MKTTLDQVGESLLAFSLKEEIENHPNSAKQSLILGMQFQKHQTENCHHSRHTYLHFGTDIISLDTLLQIFFL